MAWLVVTPPAELWSRLFDGDTTCFPAAAGLDSCKSRLILVAAIVVGSGDGSSPLLSTYRTDTWLPCTSGTRLHLKNFFFKSQNLKRQFNLLETTDLRFFCFVLGLNIVEFTGAIWCEDFSLVLKA